VLLGARQWNDEVATPSGRRLWGRRRVQYFVAVPYSGQFAPCKFCAFLPIPSVRTTGEIAVPSRMTLPLYLQLDESEPRFDGHVGQRHLTKRLGMVPKTPADDARLATQFERWLELVGDLIMVHSRGPVLLVPPHP
jgi:hypothetical protein